MATERRDHMLQATALVNEAYIRLIDSGHVAWQDRNHFFVLAAQLMRRILVDFARSHLNQRRGGAWLRTTLHEGLAISSQPNPELVELDDLLLALAAMDPRQA